MIGFVLGTACRTKFFERHGRIAAQTRRNRDKSLPTKFCESALLTDLSARGLEIGGTNSFERICSRENIQGGCVTTALRIIVKLRSVDSSTAHVPVDD
jgi:hypothetical protein